MLVKTVNEDLTEEARKITAPTMLLWGEKDTEAPVEFCYRYRTLVPGAAPLNGGAMVVIPQADHFLYEGSGSYLAAYHIERWLSRTPVGDATIGGRAQP